MKRISTPTAQAGLFVDGNPGIGQPATRFDASWCNAVQEEIVAAVLGAGLALNPAANNQLLQAIGIIAGANAATYKNLIINGSFDIWQRGTTFAPTVAGGAIYGPDRWRLSAGTTGGAGTAAVTQALHTLGQAAVPGSPRFYLRWSQTDPADLGPPQLRTSLEDIRRFSNYDVTFSFWAKANINTTLRAKVTQNFGSGGSTPNVELNQTVALTTDWQRFTFVINLNSINGAVLGPGDCLQIEFELPVGWTGIFDLSDVQLEAGQVATGFERRPVPLELVLCERYFQKSYAYETPPGAATAPGFLAGFAGGSILHGLRQRLRQRMRQAPVVTWYGNVSGTAGKVVRISDSVQFDVTATVGATDDQLGSPQFGSALGNEFYSAHWTASAEF